VDVAAAQLPPALPLSLQPEPQRVPLGTLLVRDGLIATDQLELALAEKEQSGRRLGEIVVAKGWVEADALAGLLAEQHGLEFLDLAAAHVDPAVAALLPEKLARRYDALPIRFVSENVVLIAVSDPTNVVASDDLKLALGMNLKVGVAASPALARAIDRVHQPQPLEEPLPTFAADDIRGTATSAPAITLVNQLLAKAIEAGASDVHFEPESDRMGVRMRVDGVMRNLGEGSKEMQPAGPS